MADQTSKSAAPAAVDARIIDARGLKCPLPVLRLRKVALAHPAETILDLRADDPAAEKDVPAFCAEMGWSCERRSDGLWRVARPA